VQNHRTQFGSRNHGRTAEDMLERFRVGKERLLDAQDHCRAKSSASRAVADDTSRWTSSAPLHASVRIGKSTEHPRHSQR
jgi:hypothetical protein